MSGTQSPRQELQSYEHLCPSWCEHEHLGLAEDPCGFHHDGAVTSVDLEGPPSSEGADCLFVNVSQLEKDGELEEAFVEVQDESHTLALLTPGDCVLLAQALLEGAEQIRQQR